MIKSIKIQNFQSHKDSYLEFDENINVIIGDSDSGKTAVLRALNWCIHNKPTGDSFRSKWGGNTSVTIQDDKNNTISRIKTGKQNIYRLNGNDSIAGVNVPEHIKNILNFSDLNIQYQMDSPFLISQTAGTSGKYLNKIINLDIITRASQNIEKQKKESSRNVKYYEQELEKQENELTQFDNLDELDIQLKQLEEVFKKEKNVRKKYTILYECIQSIKEIQTKINKQNKYDNIDLDILEKLHDKYKKLLRFKEQLSRLINNIINFSIDIHKLKQLASKEKNINTYLKLIDNEKKVQKSKKKCITIIENLYNIYSRVQKINDSLKQKEIEFKKLFADKCPVCGK